MPAPRTGSIARNAISQTPFASASTTLPAASKGTNSIGTASRLANSRASSDDTPRGSPLAGSFCASNAFPKLIAAGSLPLGASVVTTFFATLSAMAPHTREKGRERRRADEASGFIDDRWSVEPIRARLHCKAARPHSYDCHSTRERNDGQDHQDQSRGHFKAVLELLACGDGRGRAEARVLRRPSRRRRGWKSAATR